MSFFTTCIAYVLAIWALSLCPIVKGKVIEGPFRRDNFQWAYFTSFCYDRTGGKIHIEAVAESGPSDANYEFVIYNDNGDTHFEDYWTTGNSCEYKVKGASNVFNLTTLMKSPSGVDYPVHAIRPRWLYFVFANCASENVRISSVKVIMTNEGGIFSKHFGKDEQGIFEALIFFLLWTICMIMLFVFGFTQARTLQNKALTEIMAILLTLTGIHFFIVLFHLAHYATYSNDGKGVPQLTDAARVLYYIPQMMLIFVYISVSKGWQISDMRIPDKRVLFEIMAIYLALVIALLYWYFNDSSDPLKLQDLYQSPAGRIILALRILLLFWFAHNIYGQIREARVDKKCFYIGFGIFGCCWFLIQPATVAAADLAEPWARKKIVEIMRLVLDGISYLILWILFRPSAGYLYRQAHGDDQGASTRLPMGTGSHATGLSSAAKHEDSEDHWGNKGSGARTSMQDIDIGVGESRPLDMHDRDMEGDEADLDLAELNSAEHDDEHTPGVEGALAAASHV